MVGSVERDFDGQARGSSNDIGADQCYRVADAVDELSVIESQPHMEGRNMIMVLAPDGDAQAAAK